MRLSGSQHKTPSPCDGEWGWKDAWFSGAGLPTATEDESESTEAEKGGGGGFWDCGDGEFGQADTACGSGVCGVGGLVTVVGEDLDTDVLGAVTAHVVDGLCAVSSRLGGSHGEGAECAPTVGTGELVVLHCIIGRHANCGVREVDGVVTNLCCDAGTYVPHVDFVHSLAAAEVEYNPAHFVVVAVWGVENSIGVSGGLPFGLVSVGSGGPSVWVARLSRTATGVAVHARGVGQLGLGAGIVAVSG